MLPLFFYVLMPVVVGMITNQKGPINQRLKNRRRQIHKAVTTSPQPVTELAPAAEVPDGARRERSLQRTRLMERRSDALRSGTLLDHEAADPELLRESAAYEDRERNNLVDTLRGARRRDAASQSRAFGVGAGRVHGLHALQWAVN